MASSFIVISSIYLRGMLFFNDHTLLKFILTFKKWVVLFICMLLVREQVGQIVVEGGFSNARARCESCCCDAFHIWLAGDSALVKMWRTPSSLHVPLWDQYYPFLCLPPLMGVWVVSRIVSFSICVCVVPGLGCDDLLSIMFIWAKVTGLSFWQLIRNRFLLSQLAHHHRNPISSAFWCWRILTILFSL